MNESTNHETWLQSPQGYEAYWGKSPLLRDPQRERDIPPSQDPTIAPERRRRIRHLAETAKKKVLDRRGEEGV